MVITIDECPMYIERVLAFTPDTIINSGPSGTITTDQAEVLGQGLKQGVDFLWRSHPFLFPAIDREIKTLGRVGFDLLPVKCPS